jgi:hypothetical protein
MMVLLKLAQDFVAVNVLGGWKIATGHPRIARRSRSWVVWSRDSRFCSEGREDLVRRTEVYLVEVEGPKHAQRRVAVRSGRLFAWRCRFL